MLDIGINDVVKENGTLFFGKVEEVKFNDDEFDVIYGVHLIEHLENITNVFEKCYNALKKDGTLFFITPNADSKGLKIFKDSWFKRAARDNCK